MADTDLQAETPKTTGVTGSTLLFGALTGTGEAVADTIAVSAFAASGIIRELLTADRTYYIRTDGSDSNDGLADTSGGAWATIQHAWDTICETIDIGGNVLTIQLGDGDYAESPALVAAPIGGHVRIQGNTGDQTAVTVAGQWTVSNQTEACSVEYLTIDASLVSIAFYAFTEGCFWYLNHVDFIAANTFALVFADEGAKINIYKPPFPAAFGATSFEITGDSYGYALYADNGSQIYWWSDGLTLTGANAVSNAWAASFAASVVIAIAGSITGSATGKRYDAQLNGVFQTYGAGATYFPGDVAGTTATGGQYA